MADPKKALWFNYNISVVLYPNTGLVVNFKEYARIRRAKSVLKLLSLLSNSICFRTHLSFEIFLAFSTSLWEFWLRILYSRKREDPDLTLAVQPLKIKQCVCACTRYNNCHISRVQLKFVHVEIVQPVRLSELCQVPFQRPSVCTGLNADLVSASRATPVLSIVIIWIYRFITSTLWWSLTSHVVRLVGGVG